MERDNQRRGAFTRRAAPEDAGNLEAAKIYQAVGAVLDDESVTPRALEKAVEAYKKAGREPEAKKTLNTLQSRYPEYLQRSAKTL